MDFLFNNSFWFTVLRCTTPVLLATIAALIANRSGLLNLGVEGAMSLSALFGVLGSGYTQNLFIGILCGFIAGVGFTLILAFCVQQLKCDAVITGVAMNLMASGVAVFLLNTIVGNKNNSNSISSLMYPVIHFTAIESIPIIGVVLSGHNIITYLAFLSAVIIYIVLKKTKFGIRLRAVGEAEMVADSVGLNVKRIRYQAMFLSGMFASLGGMYLSMGYVNRFTAGMVAGRGYIALATEAMAAGNSLLGMFSSLLYGFGSAIAIYLQNDQYDPYLITIIPYMAIIIFYMIFMAYYSMKEKKVYKTI